VYNKVVKKDYADDHSKVPYNLKSLTTSEVGFDPDVKDKVTGRRIV